MNAPATVTAFLNPQPVRLNAADAWEAGRERRAETLASWSAFLKTSAACGDDNDPSTPAAWHCDGCDKVRDYRRMFCPNCVEVTSAWQEGEACVLRLVPPVVAQVAQLNDRLMALILKDGALTASEHAELAAFEREAMS